MSELEDLQNASTLATAPQIEAEKSDEQKAAEHEEAQKEYAVAALSEHPGWKTLRDMMVQDIDDFRTLKFVNMKQYTDKELGEVVRGEHAVANKLQAYLKKVDDAVKAVAHGRSE